MKLLQLGALLNNMKKLCVVGNPIEHSLSPDIHARFAAGAGIQIDYQKKCLPKGEFNQGIQVLIDEGFTGFSVTVPFKEDAFQLYLSSTTYTRNVDVYINDYTNRCRLWDG